MEGFLNFIRSFLPTSEFNDMPKAATSQPIQQLAKTIAPATQPVQAATPQPTPATQGFKYRMGSSDYSDIAPQVQNALKGTPLEPYANEFVQAGNRHQVDPRVLVTIANNESSLGNNYPGALNPKYTPSDPYYVGDTYNPFGYDARSGGMVTGKDGKQYVNVNQGLKNAGFTSLPHAIDALTARFSTTPVNPTGPAYQAFRDNATPENLQAAYNASDDEKQGYIDKTNDFVKRAGFQ